MVSTSMLPGSGTTELSATPKRINPRPPKWRSHRHSCVTLKNKRIADIEFLRSSLSPMSGTGNRESLGNQRFCRIQEVWTRGGGQNAAFFSIAKKKLHSIQACRVEIIIDILSEIALNIRLAQAHPRRPLPSDPLQILCLKSMIARFLKY